MRQKSFFLQLIIVSIASAIGLYFLHQIPEFADDASLSWMSMGFYTLLCVLMYFAAYKAALSENKHDFTNTFMGFLILKLFVSAGLVLGYFYVAEPASKLFVLPFFGVYIIYTVFEVAFMSKLGKMTSNQ